MFTGPEIVAALTEVGITHVVWLPDSAIGQWEQALATSPRLTLVRVCREGERLAAGRRAASGRPAAAGHDAMHGPLRIGQCVRNVLFDLKLPLLSLVGVRNELSPDWRDSARLFAEPIIKAWGLDHRWIRTPDDKPALTGYLHSCRQQHRAGTILLAEEALG